MVTAIAILSGVCGWIRLGAEPDPCHEPLPRESRYPWPKVKRKISKGRNLKEGRGLGYP